LGKRYKGRLDEKADDFIDCTTDGVKRMQEMIRDLLEFSKVGMEGIDLKPFAVSLAFDEAVLNLKQAIEEIDAVVTRDELPTLLADGSQISRLFQNLIGNALKFHGKDTLRVHVSAERKGNEWLFSVRDTGIGIDPKQTRRIFVIFQRLHTREQYPGTGLGLAICKRIVERHGGRIWVKSKPGEGSTFYFTIPD
jgi:light-regulated signal transduction histidine kinase (bacteriophytochrome)